MNKLVNNLLAAGLLVFMFVAMSLVAPPTVRQVSAHHCFGHAGTGPVSIAECVDAGACLDSTGTSCPAQTSNKQKVNDVVKLVINTFSVVVGVASVIMIIVGGFKYVISSGDSNNINSAKNTILYAIIGLVIVALAQIIVKFVLAKAR